VRVKNRVDSSKCRSLLGKVREKQVDFTSIHRLRRIRRRGEHVTDSEAETNARGYVATTVAERVSEVLSLRQPVTLRSALLANDSLWSDGKANARSWGRTMPATRGRLMANQNAVRVTHGGSGVSIRERHRHEMAC